MTTSINIITFRKAALIAGIGYLLMLASPIAETMFFRFADLSNFDDADGSLDQHNAILNQLAVQRLGWKQAVGRQLRQDGKPPPTP
jgi:hypothetical protein